MTQEIYGRVGHRGRFGGVGRQCSVSRREGDTGLVGGHWTCEVLEFGPWEGHAQPLQGRARVRGQGHTPDSFQK